MKKTILAISIFLLGLAAPLPAETITYQGRLKEASLPVNDNRLFLFEFCDDETAGSCTPSPSGAQSFAVQNGLFKSTFTVPAVNLASGQWYLKVSVAGTPLTPRERLTAVPYSVFAATAAYSPQAVQKTGDAMSGQLTLSGSTLTVTGNEFSVGGSTFVVQYGKVGIGVPAPSERLTLPYSSNLGWEYSSSNANVAHLIGKTSNGAGPLEFRTTFNPGPTGQVFKFTSLSAANAMVIQNDGNVGINTGSPLGRLDVTATGTSPDDQAQIWRDSTGAVVSSVSATGMVMGVRFIGDGSGLINVAATTGVDASKLPLAGGLMSGSIAMGGNHLYSVSTIAASGNITAARYQINGSTVLSGSGTNNIFVGSQAGDNNAAGTDNAYLGAYSGYNNYGVNNAVVGSQAGTGHSGEPYSDTVLVGYKAGYDLGSTANNILIGYMSGANIRSGGSNIIIGSNQSASGPAANSTASNELNIGGVLFGDLSAKTIGISTRAPQAALDVVATGSLPGDMVQIWRNSAGSIQSSMSATGVMMASRFVGDGAGLTGVSGSDDSKLPLAGGTMAGNLTMGGNNIYSASTITATGNITAALYQINGGTVLAVLPGVGGIGVGPYTGGVNSGSYNSFFGNQAGRFNTTGGNNTFVGYQAGTNNNVGTNNSFIGAAAGVSNVRGNNNTFTGYLTGTSNTTGESNVLIGLGAGRFNESGTGNAVMGTQAGGSGAGAANSFSSSTIMGHMAGYNVTSGSNNTFLGWQAGYNVTSGNGNIIIGYGQNAQAAGSNSSLNIGGLLFGDLSARTIGISTGIPQAALDVVATGSGPGDMVQIWRNSAGAIVSSVSATGQVQAARFIGDGSGLTNVAATTGVDASKVSKAGDTMTGNLTMGGNNIYSASTITATGNITAALYQINGSTVLAVLPGVSSIGLGPYTGGVNSGSYNTFLGYKAGRLNTTASNNTFVGYSAGESNTTASNNTFIGNAAGIFNVSGTNNTFTGYLSGNRNTTGEFNVLIGLAAGHYNQSGSGNSVMGTMAGGYGAGAVNSFSSSTVMGHMAGYNLTTGSNNTFLGWQAGYNVTSGNGNIIIGYGQNAQAAGSNSSLNIGGLLFGDLSARTIGISTGIPQAALDVVATGSGPGDMAQIWRNSAGTIVSSVSATGQVQAVRFIGDGSGLTNVAATTGVDASRVSKAGDTMIGQLTLAGSSLTITGSGLTVGAALTNRILMDYTGGYGLVNVLGGALVLNNSGQNVGINTTLPSYTLDVGGAIRGQGQLIAAGTATVQGNTFSVGGSAFLVDGVKVGINNAAPQESLDIGSGNLRILPGQTLQWGGAANAISASGTGMLFYENSATRLHLGSTGGRGTVAMGDLASVTIDTTSALHVVAKAVTGSDGRVAVFGDLRSNGISGGQYLASGNFETTVQGADSAELAAGVRAVIRHENAGAGLVNKAYGLMVDDLQNSAGTIGSTYGVYIGTQTTGTQTNTPYSLYAADQTAWTYFGGRVGIGTESPQDTLHLVNSNPWIQIKDTGGTKGASIGMDVNKLRFDEAGVGNRMTLDLDTSRLGIGTLSPGYTLDVQGGYMNASGGLCINGTCVSSWSSVTGAWSKNGVVVSPATQTDNVLIQSTLTVAGNAFSVGGSTLVVAAGRVGVGVLNPTVALDVSGGVSATTLFASNSVSASSILKVNGGGVVALESVTANSNISATAAGARNMVFTTDSQERMRITNAGRIGVGTASPAEALDVASRVQISTRTAGDNNIDGLISYGTGGMMFQSGGNTYMRVANGGNYVGVGPNLNNNTNSPRLQVQGSLSVGSSYNSAQPLPNSLVVENRVGIGVPSPTFALDVSTTNGTDTYLARFGANGIMVSTGGAVQTTGVGNGAVTGNARGNGAVDLQTYRLAATEVASGVYSVIGGGRQNTAYDLGTTVAGGVTNTANEAYSFVGGGNQNNAATGYTAIAGGYSNTIGTAGGDGAYSFIGAGYSNETQTDYTVIGGGMENYISNTGMYGAIGGGGYNTADGQYGTIAGGMENKVRPQAYAGFIGGGEKNISTAPYSVVGGGLFNTSSGTYSAVLGGHNNQVLGSAASIAGGENNSADGYVSFVGAGQINQASGNLSVIVGGYNNLASGNDTFVGGGQGNTASMVMAAVAGGQGNLASGNASFVGGGFTNRSEIDYAVVAGGENNRAYAGMGAAIGGGGWNTVSAQYAAIAGGRKNSANGQYSFVGGGGPNATATGNEAAGNFSAVVGGSSNTVTAQLGFVGGGDDNHVYGDRGVVVGGARNIAGVPGLKFYAAVVGGQDNEAKGEGAFVGGGTSNEAFGNYAVVPGGNSNSAGGGNSFAAGYASTAAASGSFAWNDSYGDSLLNNNANQVQFKASGGFWVSTGTVYTDPGLFVDASNRVGIGTSAPVFKLHVVGGTSNAIAGLTNSVSGTDAAVYGWANSGATAVKGVAAGGYAGRFEGNVYVTNNGVNPVSPAKLQVNGDLGLGDGTDTGNKPVVVWLRNASASFISSGSIVVVGGGNAFVTTGMANAPAAIGIVYEPSGIAVSGVGRIAIAGIASAQCSGTAAIGNHVVTSATVGKADSPATPTVQGSSIGIWLEACTNPAMGRVLLR